MTVCYWRTYDMKLTFKLDAKAGSVNVYHELCVEFDDGTQKIHVPVKEDVDVEGTDLPGKLTGDERVFFTQGVDVTYVCEGLVMKVVKQFYESARDVQASNMETES